MIMMFLIERSEYYDDVSMLMMFLIEILQYDDDVSNQKGKVLMMILLIERSKY